MCCDDRLKPHQKQTLSKCHLGEGALDRDFVRFAMTHPEGINPSSDRFVGYINASLGHHLFDITQAQIKPKIQPDNSVNHIRMETAKVVNGVFHPA